MRYSRYLLLIAAFALVVGFVSVSATQTAEQVTMTDSTEDLVSQGEVCSPTADQTIHLFPPFPPDTCSKCLDACHPQDHVCILACLNGPCI